MAEFDVRDMIQQGHAAWKARVNLWNWALDSFIGGVDYVEGSYPGWSLAERNLIRHKSEEPVRDADGILVENRDYALRLARTPIPMLLAEAIGAHLSAIYEQKVRRVVTGNDRLQRWIDGSDGGVDGSNSSVEDWFPEKVAPYFLALGTLDVLCDRPPAPGGATPSNRAEAARMRIGECRARVVHPQRMRWWEPAERPGRFRRALVQEAHPDGERYRLWSEEDSRLYDKDGNPEGEPVTHPYGRVPIVRLTDVDDPQFPGIGRSRYEPIMFLQRNTYNVDSEEVLSTARDAHPIVQAPGELLRPGPDGKPRIIVMGADRILEKFRVEHGNAQVFYEGYEYLVPPASPADSLRRSSDRGRDQADRLARLTKPAGAAGTSAGTVSQSGVSKEIDERSGRRSLASVARKLGQSEWDIIELAATVLAGGPPPADFAAKLTVTYPARFNLRSAVELAELGSEFQGFLERAGRCPAVEKDIARAMIRDILPGLDEDQYAEREEAADLAIDAAADRMALDAESLAG